MDRPFKIPESVLVVIHTPALDVLLINRADAPDFWQSVTGSKDVVGEPLVQTAVREVFEETGIDCRPGTPAFAGLADWNLENIYDIYPRWLHRYAPGVTRNTEHVFGLRGPAGPRRRLLLAFQRRGHPVAATICRMNIALRLSCAERVRRAAAGRER